MGRSLLTGASAAMSESADRAEAYKFLAFNQSTGEMLSHGHRAIFALARADLREPDEAIEILNAGIAGQNLWQNQTSLLIARGVIDRLEEPWNFGSTPPGHQTRR